MINPRTTVVSAFLCNVNRRSNRSFADYMESGRTFLETPINKVIFIDEKIAADLMVMANENTIIIPFKPESNYLYDYKSKITCFNPNVGDPTKETLDYMLVMCHKTEWVKKVVEMNPFGSDQFIWVDFGFRYILKCGDDAVKEKLGRMQHVSYEKVRMGNMWNVGHAYHTDFYETIMWY